MLGRKISGRGTAAQILQTINKRLRNFVERFLAFTKFDNRGPDPRFQAEPLETRVLLSGISATALLAPRMVPGNSWTYLGTSTSTTETELITETVIGSTTFNGNSATEIGSTDGTDPQPYLADFYGFDSAGNYVNYGNESFETGDDVRETTAYSPYRLVFVNDMAAGVAYDTSNTSVDTETNDGSTTTGDTIEEDHELTLVSTTLAPITVPAGTFNTYEGIDVDTSTAPDGDDPPTVTTQTSQVWYAPGIGTIKITNSDGDDIELTSYHVAGDHLAFTQQPTNAETGDTIKPAITVSTEDSNNAVDLSTAGSITLSLNTITGDGTLTGTLTQPLVNGVATFSDISIDDAGSYTLTATDDATPPVPQATSSIFNIGGTDLLWTGAGDGQNWSDAKNWDQDIAPVNGDSLTFPTGSPLTSNNDIADLSINNIDIQGSGYTLTGNPISLTGGLTSEAGNNTYDIDTTLVGSPTIDDQTGDLTIQSDLSGDNLTVDGSGAVTFDQTDSYTGDTTLSSGVTIDDDAVTDAFGDGDLTIGAGADPVSIDAASGADASLDNDITFQDGATLATDPDVTLTGTVTVNGNNFVDPVGSNDVLKIIGDSIKGSGTLTVNGGGGVLISGTVVGTVNLAVQSGYLDIGAKLAGGTGQVTVSGGILELEGTGSSLGVVSGTGSINVDGGTLQTDGSTVDGGAPQYTAPIVLNVGGTIKYQDTVDGFGLGTGGIDLKGGLFENATDGGTVSVDSPITVDGLMTFDGGKGMTFNGDGNVFQPGSGPIIQGSVKFGGAIKINNGTVSTQTTNSTDSLDFAGGLTGTGTLNIDGPGKTSIEGDIPDGLLLNATGKTTGTTGTLWLSANLSGVATPSSPPQLTISGGTVVIDGSNNANGSFSGTGAIDVQSGILETDPTSPALGAPLFDGTITLESAGTIKYLDTGDGFGLGAGTLDLKGGTFTNPSDTAVVSIQNAVTVEGDVALNAGPSLNFGNAVTFKTGALLTVTGSAKFSSGAVLNGTSEVDTTAENQTLYLNGGLTGTGTLTLDGLGDTYVQGAIAAGVNLIVAGFLNDGPGSVLLAVTALNGNTSNQVTVSGGVLQLLGDLTGFGGIDEKSGTVESNVQGGHFPGAAGYKGIITLEGGTLVDYDAADDFGFGQGMLDLKGGKVLDAADNPVTIGNPITVDGPVTMDGTSGITLTDSATFNAEADLTTMGQVKFSGGEVLNGSAEADTFASGGILYLNGGMTGTGTLSLDGPGNTYVQGTIASGVNLLTLGQTSGTTGSVLLAVVTLSGNTTSQVTLKGGTVQLLADAQGPGGIDVKSGTLESDVQSGAFPGASNYKGIITLESGGTLKDLDLADANGFGTGTIDVQGGKITNGVAGTPTINNPLTIEGNFTIEGAGGLIFNGPSAAISNDVVVTASGNVTFNNPISVDGTASFNTSTTDDTLQLKGGITTTLGLTLDGPGSTYVSGAVADGAQLFVPGVLAGATGEVFLGANLKGSNGQVSLTGGKLEMEGAGSVIGTLSGSGGITVSGSGILLSDESTNDAGDANYTGTIMDQTGGTVKVFDTVDANGLGTGFLNLAGGLLQNSAPGTATLATAVTVSANSTISSRTQRLKFNDSLTLKSGTTLDVVGNLALTGALAGSGTLQLDGGTFAVSTSNPDFTGNVTVDSGTVQVLNSVDDSLGSGNLQEVLQTQKLLQAVNSIGDPVMDNPLVVAAGTMVIDGQFTFPNGITVDAGATLEIEGAGAAVVDTGPLSGGGTIVTDNATFSDPGPGDTFTGKITNQTGLVTPTISISDAGGTFTGSPFPATVTLSALGLTPGSTLDGISPTVTYSLGSTVSGTGATTAPSAVGTYTAVANFAGDTNYAAVQSTPVTFSITSQSTTTTTTQPSITQQINNSAVTFTGRWWYGSFEPGFTGNEFVNDGNQLKGTKSVQFNLNLPGSGTYNVSIWNPAGSQNATNVPVDIITSTGTQTVTVNEQQNGGTWFSLGTFTFGDTGSVIVNTTGTNGFVVADAVKFTPVTLDANPSAPLNFAAAPASKTSIQLKWNEVATVSSYVIQQSTDDKTWTTVATPTAPASSATINNLTPGDTYYFQIQAIDATGGSTFTSTGPIALAAENSIVQQITDPNVTLTGNWWYGSFENNYGSEFLNDGNQQKGTKSVQFNVALPTAGSYDVSLWIPGGSQNATSVPVDILTTSGTTTITINEQTGGWLDLGSYLFGSIGSVIIRTDGTDGLVVANAVRFTPTV
jgi:fibronectin-binding autotransporter adhesin